MEKTSLILELIELHMNVNVDLMEQYVSHINGGITINIDVSVKYIIHIKKLCLESCYM